MYKIQRARHVRAPTGQIFSPSFAVVCNLMTDMMHLKAIEIISKWLRKSVAGDPKAREEMALGQVNATATSPAPWASKASTR